MMGSHGALVVKVPPGATRPARPDGSAFTVEFRRRSGWDQPVPRDAVLVHEVRTNGLSYLHPTEDASLVAGDMFVTPDPAVFIYVNRLDPRSGTATVSIWDIPDGCVRKDARSPARYVIEGGKKRLIVGTQLPAHPLPTARVVPEHGLASLPDGPDYGRTALPTLPGP